MTSNSVVPSTVINKERVTQTLLRHLRGKYPEAIVIYVRTGVITIRSDDGAWEVKVDAIDPRTKL